MSNREILPPKIQEAIFQRLLSRPENKICADCSAKSPTWASIDFGVFICMNCSGAHRALGPQITRVRSVNLDSWEPAWIEPLENVGNKIANDYFEYSMSNSFKPRLGATLVELTRFVEDKYKKRFYAPKNHLSPYEEFQQAKLKRGQAEQSKKDEKTETTSSNSQQKSNNNLSANVTANKATAGSNINVHRTESQSPPPLDLINANHRANSSPNEDLLIFGPAQSEALPAINTNKSKSNIDLVDLTLPDTEPKPITSGLVHHHSHSCNDLDVMNFKTCPTTTTTGAFSNNQKTQNNNMFQNMHLKKGNQASGPSQNQGNLAKDSSMPNILSLYNSKSESSNNAIGSAKAAPQMQSNPLQSYQQQNHQIISPKIEEQSMSKPQVNSFNIMEMYNKKPEENQISGNIKQQGGANPLADPFFDANTNNNNAMFYKHSGNGYVGMNGHPAPGFGMGVFPQAHNPHQGFLQANQKQQFAPALNQYSSVQNSKPAGTQINPANILSLYKNDEMKDFNLPSKQEQKLGAINNYSNNGIPDPKHFTTTNNGLTDLRGMVNKTQGVTTGTSRPFDTINAFYPLN